MKCANCGVNGAKYTYVYNEQASYLEPQCDSCYAKYRRSNRWGVLIASVLVITVFLLLMIL